MICGPNLLKNLVQRRKVSSKRFGKDARGQQFCFRSAREPLCADFVGSHGDVARAEGTNGWISICIWVLN
jgi:hypothetical protein